MHNYPPITRPPDYQTNRPPNQQTNPTDQHITMSTGTISSDGFATLGDGGCSGPHCKNFDYSYKPITPTMFLRDEDLITIKLFDMSRNNLWMSSITQSQSRLFQC